MLLYSSSKFYTPLNARTIRRNKTPTCSLKQHFSPTCRRLFINQSRAEYTHTCPTCLKQRPVCSLCSRGGCTVVFCTSFPCYIFQKGSTVTIACSFSQDSHKQKKCEMTMVGWMKTYLKDGSYPFLLHRMGKTAIRNVQRISCHRVHGILLHEET